VFNKTTRNLFLHVFQIFADPLSQVLHDARLRCNAALRFGLNPVLLLVGPAVLKQNFNAKHFYRHCSAVLRNGVPNTYIALFNQSQGICGMSCVFLWEMSPSLPVLLPVGGL
jgi:hypothetical protein